MPVLFEQRCITIWPRLGDVRIVSAYFLPTRRVRRDLMRVVRRGGRVQLLLAGKSDVPVSQLAARSLYYRLLKAGVEIYEYQPQILHAKLVLADGIIYVGSSNLDIRSLNLNYELMLRFEDKTTTSEAQEIFERALKHSGRIEFHQWWKTQSFWQSVGKITGRIFYCHGLIPSSPCGSVPHNEKVGGLRPDREQS